MFRASEADVIGVDGCRGGWISVRCAGDFSAWHIKVSADIRDALGTQTLPSTIAIDMPIGLPEQITGSGRGPEQLVRALLGQRQSSVFSIPSRPAVEAPDYAEACRLATLTSLPSRKVAKQAYNLFPRIRELDRWLRNQPQVRDRAYEAHPELAFRLLKGVPLVFPKKSMEGRQERLDLLAKGGIPAGLLAEHPPSGAKPDDLLDAMACAIVARRIQQGEAQRFPQQELRDSHGLSIAIWG